MPTLLANRLHWYILNQFPKLIHPQIKHSELLISIFLSICIISQLKQTHYPIKTKNTSYKKSCCSDTLPFKRSTRWPPQRTLRKVKYYKKMLLIDQENFPFRKNPHLELKWNLKKERKEKLTVWVLLISTFLHKSLKMFKEAAKCFLT